MKNTKQIQIVVVLAVVLIMGLLLAQPIKGLVTEPQATESTSSAMPMFTMEDVSAMSKQGMNPTLADEITKLEGQLAGSQGEDRIAILEQIAQKWDDLAKYAPQGFVYEEMAKTSPKFEYWLQAGDAYRKAYTNLQDTVLARELNRLAMDSYQQAVDLDGSSLAAKTGLGATIVTGTNNPMAGIAILREVVASDPKNLEANKTLGLFSMQSRQFDRAIERFLTVIEIKPDAESYFYLATSYENIGLKNEAIAAFQKSKEMAADPTLSQFIERRIEELSK
ncbi:MULTISPECIES: tetratricopeptide repeat protein [Sphingobacterium]|uniref:Tetratricopeptide repeat protein n=1 Tax=Sphingobacterium populi TaxID=1812824 RepID=A0ABW5UCV6_9SPHI|nr:hypothetical protein [Sphingobacterium sp. CFCC 11742]